MKHFDVLDKITGISRGPGGVICLYDRLITLKNNDRVIPGRVSVEPGNNYKISP